MEGHQEIFVTQGTLLSLLGHGNSKAAEQGINMCKFPERDAWFFGKDKHMRKIYRVNATIDDILLESDSITSDRRTNNNTSRLNLESKNILAPKRTLLNCQMGNNGSIVFLPYEIDPIECFIFYKIYLVVSKTRHHFEH